MLLLASLVALLPLIQAAPQVISHPFCPSGCDPLSNQCHITAQTCIYPDTSKVGKSAHCACRAGYKATTADIADGDVSQQWRLPAPEGSFRVWVAQGVACDTLCTGSDSSAPCGEITELSADCL